MQLAGIADVLGPFLLLLGGLIFFHELGHFLVAKWFKVKVEQFSIGFGPAIVRRQFGETEYRIAWLPLGGYCKMLGELPGEELPTEDLHRTLESQSVPRRIAIYLAGPAMNLLLPVVLLTGIYMAGMPVETTRIGEVAAGSLAEAAGLRGGDRITSIDGVEVTRWREFAEAVEAAGQRPVRLGVDRGDGAIEVELGPARPGGLGLQHSARAAVLGIRSLDGPAGRAGFRSGDRVVRLNGAEIADWSGLEAALSAASGSLEFEAERPASAGSMTPTAAPVPGERLRVTVPAAGGVWSLAALGIVSGDLEVRTVVADGPAARAGILPGDLLIEAGGAPMESFLGFAEVVRSSDGEPIKLLLAREGKEIKREVTPERRGVPELGEVFVIGVTGGAPRVAGEMTEHAVRNPFEALVLGAGLTWEILVRTVDAFGQLATRRVGLENLAGPIGIAVVAAESFGVGWFQFLWICAVISVNLALINLLPIPVLDGGQIVLALSELVKGSPVTMRTREIAQQVGVSVILLLMGFAFWNDLSRYWAGIVGFFRDLV